MRIFLMSLLCFFCLGSNVSFAKNETIAVVNIEKVVFESKAYKAAQSALEDVFKQKKADLDEKRKNLEELGRKIREKSSTAEQEKFRALQQEYTELANEYVRNAEQAELESQRKMSELILNASQTLAKEKKIDLILDANAVPFYQDSMDVSKDLLTTMNKIWESAKK